MPFFFFWQFKIIRIHSQYFLPQDPGPLIESFSDDFTCRFRVLFKSSCYFLSLFPSKKHSVCPTTATHSGHILARFLSTPSNKKSLPISDPLAITRIDPGKGSE